MNRYWIEFDAAKQSLPIGSQRGCGVTAHNIADAKVLLSEKMFNQAPIPDFKRCIENVDISTLDQNHVVPNMGNIFERGIWFPQGYS
jgi:hypothetical protein